MDNEERALERRLETGSWGAFFVWVGVAFLTEIGWGVGLLGVAAIMLGTQAIRAAMKLGPEAFWVVVGCLFAAAGTMHLLGIDVALGPFVLLGVGVAILLAALFGRTQRPEH